MHSTVPALVCCLLAVTKFAIPNQIVKPPGGNLAYTGILWSTIFAYQSQWESKPLTCYPQHLNQSIPG